MPTASTGSGLFLDQLLECDERAPEVASHHWCGQSVSENPEETTGRRIAEAQRDLGASRASLAKSPSASVIYARDVRPGQIALLVSVWFYWNGNLMRSFHAEDQEAVRQPGQRGVPWLRSLVMTPVVRVLLALGLTAGMLGLALIRSARP